MPPDGRKPDILVAVVTFNSAAVIEAFLRALPPALEGAGSTTVVVVDNGSSDETTTLVRAVAPWATLIESGTNRGYAAGINIALRHTTAQRGVYVLNPDTVPEPRSVGFLIEAVETRPGVGIAVPRIVDPNGTLLHSLRRESTIVRAAAEAVLGGQRAARFPWASEMIQDPHHYIDGATADWATGAAMFISSATVTTVGPWNEEFFLYSEETDYALRARDAGLRLSYVAAAQVSHRGGDLNVSPWLWSLAAVNRVRLYARRHGPLRGQVFRLVMIFSEGLRALFGRTTSRAALLSLIRGVRLPTGIVVTPRA